MTKNSVILNIKRVFNDSTHYSFQYRYRWPTYCSTIRLRSTSSYFISAIRKLMRTRRAFSHTLWYDPIQWSIRNDVTAVKIVLLIGRL